MKQRVVYLFAALLVMLSAQCVNAQNTINKGYRGLVDWVGVVMPVDGGQSEYTALFTYHGYQFVPQLFAGVGVGALTDGFCAGDVLMVVRLRSDIL
ncbi:MAG: hypothetical protein IKY82_03985 [Alistipes sp.]|nr:hypothetical protein [Alistipes sp.]